MMKLLGFAAIIAAAAMAVSGSAFAGGPVAPTNAVPEPATLALMASGVGALLVLKFRKKK